MVFNWVSENFDILLIILFIALPVIEIILTSGVGSSIYHRQNSIAVLEDPKFSSLSQIESSGSGYNEFEKGDWTLLGNFQYNENLNGLVVHPWPKNLPEGRGVEETRKSGVKQTVKLPKSEELNAVLAGQNIVHHLDPDKNGCSDSKLILKVRSLESGETLSKRKIVGEKPKNISISISEFAGEKVEIGGYGHYGGDGCGQWSGEFTLLKSLDIRGEEHILKQYSPLGAERNEQKNREKLINSSSSETVELSTNKTYPKIKHKAQWWRKIDSPPYKKLKPGHCQLFGGWSRTVIEPPVETCINDHGYRGKSYNKSKSEDAFRIMAVGDAVTFGQGVRDNETYPAYLERYLDSNPDYPNKEFQVLNYGFPAWNTKKEVRMFEKHGVDYNPDLVILQYMENDAQRVDYIKQELIPEYYENLSEELDDKEAARVISQRKGFRRERQERRNLTIENEMENVSRNFEKLDKMSKKHGFEVLLMHYSTEFSERHKNYVRNEAKRLGWSFYDSDLARLNYTSQDYLINPEHDFYLNSLGYNLTARYMTQHLEEQNIIEKAASSKKY